MFFLGLEMASVPLACMVAFDKDRKNSAEGAAKYILVATFSSGIMLFGISFIYAATGTLYFDDVAAAIKTSPLAIMGLVFFFSGLGFKISLVPFHFWTADTYQGAPTPVTGYLSVISKGAAAITLCIILMKVFQPLVAYWEHLLYIVIVLSITVANLFAIRQSELKRFMAFSCVYRGQHGSLHRDQRGGAKEWRSYGYGSLQRLLPDQPEAVVPAHAGTVLTGRYPAICRYVLEVLRVHGCSPAG